MVEERAGSEMDDDGGAVISCTTATLKPGGTDCIAFMSMAQVFPRVLYFEIVFVASKPVHGCTGILLLFLDGRRDAKAVLSVS